jgi:hypothetical protein
MLILLSTCYILTGSHCIQWKTDRESWIYNRSKKKVFVSLWFVLYVLFFLYLSFIFFHLANLLYHQFFKDLFTKIVGAINLEFSKDLFKKKIKCFLIFFLSIIAVFMIWFYDFYTAFLFEFIGNLCRIPLKCADR